MTFLMVWNKIFRKKKNISDIYNNQITIDELHEERLQKFINFLDKEANKYIDLESDVNVIYKSGYLKIVSELNNKIINKYIFSEMNENEEFCILVNKDKDDSVKLEICHNNFMRSTYYLKLSISDRYIKKIDRETVQRLEVLFNQTIYDIRDFNDEKTKEANKDYNDYSGFKVEAVRITYLNDNFNFKAFLNYSAYDTEEFIEKYEELAEILYVLFNNEK